MKNYDDIINAIQKQTKFKVGDELYYWSVADVPSFPTPDQNNTIKEIWHLYHGKIRELQFTCSGKDQSLEIITKRGLSVNVECNLFVNIEEAMNYKLQKISEYESKHNVKLVVDVVKNNTEFEE